MRRQLPLISKFSARERAVVGELAANISTILHTELVGVLIKFENASVKLQVFEDMSKGLE